MLVAGLIPWTDYTHVNPMFGSDLELQNGLVDPRSNEPCCYCC